jgi:hypothetical protein
MVNLITRIYLAWLFYLIDFFFFQFFLFAFVKEKRDEIEKTFASEFFSSPPSPPPIFFSNTFDGKIKISEGLEET